MSSLAGEKASSIGTAMVMSAMLPGVSATATIRPQPSARQWIFVVLPLRETPTAWLNSPLFHLTPSDAPSHWNCRAQAPQGLTLQQRSRRRCAARLLFGPDAQAPIVDGLRRSILGRHVAPASTRLQDVKDAADHPPIIDAGLARLVVREMRIQSCPGRVR